VGWVMALLGLYGKLMLSGLVPGDLLSRALLSAGAMMCEWLLSPSGGEGGLW